MAEMGHFIIGFSIIIPILYFSDGKFNKKVAAIFIINNWIGPDSAQAYGFLEDLIGLDFHWFIPYLIWAIPLALFFSYLSRFSVERTERYFKFVDDGKRDINWKNSYLLCVSGGLLHTITDAIFRHDMYNSTLKLLDDFLQPKLGELNHLASYGIDVGGLQIISYLILVVITLLAVFIVDRDLRSLLIFFGIFCGITLALVFTFGDKIVGEEYDVAVVILSVLFIFAPLMLLFYVDKSVRNNPTIALEKPRIDAKLGLKVVGSISLLLSAVFLAVGIIAIVNPSLVNFVDISDELFSLLGIVITIASIVMVINSVGLFLKVDVSRKILIITYSVFTIFIYPLVIILYLCQDDVKALFYGDRLE
jgi:hypothetical protein